MVEGPGCKLKGLKIKGRIKGQAVKSVKGNATDKVFCKQLFTLLDISKTYDISLDLFKFGVSLCQPPCRQIIKQIG